MPSWLPLPGENASPAHSVVPVSCRRHWFDRPIARRPEKSSSVRNEKTKKNGRNSANLLVHDADSDRETSSPHPCMPRAGSSGAGSRLQRRRCFGTQKESPGRCAQGFVVVVRITREVSVLRWVLLSGYAATGSGMVAQPRLRLRYRRSRRRRVSCIFLRPRMAVLASCRLQTWSPSGSR